MSEKEYPLLINGRRISTSREHKVINPFDGSVAGITFMAGGEEMEDALASSHAAFAALKAMPAYRKAEAIGRVAEGLKARAEELARTIAVESGKTIRDARAEVKRAEVTFQIASEESKRLGGEVLPLDIAPAGEGRFAIVRRFPVGTVLGITPFNFPLNLVAHKVAPAMAAGCTIIIKPAPKTPLTAILLGEIITEAGWPAGGVNVVLCANEEVGRLAQDERIKAISFTGSASVGWRLKSDAGPRKITLELGGNAGVIVHDDADIDLAAKRCALGAFAYAGQVCISVQRIYVRENVFKRFATLFLGHVKALRAGDPLDESTDLGPMIEEAAAVRTERWVKEAVSEGATLMIGGGRRGSFFDPTVLTNTKRSMKVCSEEVFAPVVTLEKYSDFEEAVNEVNGGLYGLQAGVFTNDMGRALHAYERLDVGGVIVNDIPTFRVDNMPYGGIKMSGFGREGVRYAIEDMTELKLLALKSDLK